MDKDEILRRVMEEISGRYDTSTVSSVKGSDTMTAQNSECNLTEFVGTAIGNTIGLVIANVDSSLHEKMNIDKKYRSLGIISSRVGAGPQAMAADEAVKSSNTEVVKFELCRDMKDGGGHGITIVFGSEEVSDVRRAVETTLNALPYYMGDCYLNAEGSHVEAEYTARASSVLANFLGAEEGKAWGLLCCCPAGIGMVVADIAVKAANVNVVKTASPAEGTSFSNEYMIMLTGDSGAVKQAVIAGRDAGLQLISALGGEGKAATPSYIGK